MSKISVASHGGVTVGTTPALIGGLSNRDGITIYNTDPTVTLYVGTSAAVTTGNGIPVYPQTALPLNLGSQVPVYGVAASSIDVRYFEGYTL